MLGKNWVLHKHQDVNLPWFKALVFLSHWC